MGQAPRIYSEQTFPEHRLDAGQPPGIHSFPVFSTASLPSQLVRYNPSKTWEAQALAPPMLYEAGVG